MKKNLIFVRSSFPATCGFRNLRDGRRGFFDKKVKIIEKATTVDN